MAPGKKTIA
jgi:hypothetical protein